MQIGGLSKFSVINFHTNLNFSFHISHCFSSAKNKSPKAEKLCLGTKNRGTTQITDKSPSLDTS